MEFQKHSSGVAKAGLATGIVGSSLGLINLLGNGANAAFTASAMNQTTPVRADAGAYGLLLPSS